MTPIESLLNSVAWEKNEPPKETGSELPYATHSGVLEIMDHKFRCHRLSTGEAVFDADDFRDFMEKMGVLE